MKINLFISLTGLFFFAFYSDHLFADDAPSILVSCNASSQNYPGLPDKSFMKDVTLKGSQLSPEGKKLLGTIGHYEFWVETNLMSIFGKPQIMNFLLIIRDKKTGLNYQSVSGRHALNDEVMSGKVSIVKYDSDGMTEKSTLTLDCLTHDVPTKPVLKSVPVK